VQGVQKIFDNLKIISNLTAPKAFYYEIDYNPKHDWWPVLLDDTPLARELIKNTIEAGKVLLKAKTARVKQAIKRGYYGTIKGHKAFYVNSSEDISSIGEEIYLSHTEPIVAVIYTYIGEDIIRFSLRSNQINVREIAEMFRNGGGHTAAAGFNLVADKKRWNRILKDAPER